MTEDKKREQVSPVRLNLRPKLPVIKDPLNTGNPDLPVSELKPFGPTNGIDNINTTLVSKPTFDVSSVKGKGAVAKKFGAGAISALEQAPNIINQLSTDPETSKEATGKVLSLASSGASIGSAGGILGAGIGAGVGAAVGIIDNAGFKQRFRDKEDKLAEEEAAKLERERLNNYYTNRSSEQIKAELNLLNKANGFSATT